ncbi:MAG: hypothetical protein Q9187_001791 [Circinaria calcarea]
MPLLCEDLIDRPFVFYTSQPEKPLAEHVSLCASADRKQSQHSVFAKAAILKHFAAAPSEVTHDPKGPQADKESMASLKAPPESTVKASQLTPKYGNGVGLTRSKVSPDGRISQRDVGSKLVIVMVGLPARGKSYVTKKIARYLNWLQHDTKIFNVGERRRVVAGVPGRLALPANTSKRFLHTNVPQVEGCTVSINSILSQHTTSSPTTFAAKILVNGNFVHGEPQNDILPPPAMDPTDQPHHPSNTSLANGFNGRLEKDQRVDDISRSHTTVDHPNTEALEQTADFFDPENTKAAHIRDQVAMSTLDELLDYILDEGGSVGIFDATNSTLDRRKLIMEKIRERAGPELGVLFLESLCVDENLLESNMRLKLSGPDYKDHDPVTALADFKKRVALYQKSYVPLGDYEERNDMPYVQMIDVGRKIVSHQIRGFLSAQTVYYLLNFNLSPRQIWITRHGESMDNVNGKIGGDSELNSNGQMYAKALTKFMIHERQAWDVRQQDKAKSTHFPPRPGDTTPPNPEYSAHYNQKDRHSSKSFCVWTSMLKRSIQTAQYFDEEDFDIKQMKMLDELNAGSMEGMTYEEIRTKHSDEYELRRRDKLHYRYPGAGGEGYLDIINRLRAVIVEVERMTDHVLLVGHRSVARVLLAYFKGLKRHDVADLDVPLGMLYMLEPVSANHSSLHLCFSQFVSVHVPFYPAWFVVDSMPGTRLVSLKTEHLSRKLLYDRDPA